MLRAYLPCTSDIGETVPINRIVNDFMKQAGEFHPDPDDTTTITEQHHRKTVVVIEKRPEELGLRLNRTPSPVRVHQYKQAVHKMEALLREHREDHSPAGEERQVRHEVETP